MTQTIDMATLKATTFGDPEAKLTVKRKWLAVVYQKLLEGERAKADLEALQIKVREHNKQIEAHNQGIHIRERDRMVAAEAGFDQLDAGMDKIFGEGGAFDTIFGKKRRR